MIRKSSNGKNAVPVRKTLGRVSEIALKLETVLQNPKKDSNIDSQHVNIREEEKQVFVIVLIVCVVFIYYCHYVQR